MKTAIVVPAYNEASVIKEVVEGILSHSSAHLFVVDDCSTDDTAYIAREAGATVIQLCTNLGAWGAMQTGLRYVLQQGYQQVLTMDGDGQHLPETIEPLMAYAPESDVVIGSCVDRGSSLRKLAWRYFRTIARLPFEDLTSGLRVYRKKALISLVGREATLLDYQDVGLLLLLREQSLIIKEMPVVMSSRCNGKSRIFSSWLKVASYMATTTLICMSKLLRYKKF